MAFVYSLHGTECRLLLDDPPPRPDDPIRGVITGMVSQTVCVTIKKAVPQPEPGRWRLENAYLVARLSPVSSEWQIGMRVQVSMGEYAGQTGSILSVHPTSVTLEMDATGQVTGYLWKGIINPHYSMPRYLSMQIFASIYDHLQKGMRVQVSTGKYAGQTGSIRSVHPQSVTLRMDTTGQVTGYLRKGAVQAVRAGLTDQLAAAAA